MKKRLKKWPGRLSIMTEKKNYQVEKAKHKIDSFFMDEREVFITSQK